MPILCSCKSRCQHLVPALREPLLSPEKLTRLAPILPVILDAADEFDSDTLLMNPNCAIHGSKPDPAGAECSCTGRRWSAVEFINALQLSVRAAHSGEHHDTHPPVAGTMVRSQ